MGSPLTLSNCRELRELKISVLRLGTVDLNLISSITSANIQRIGFTELLTPAPQDLPTWIQLDNYLCHLVDRSGCRLQLEVKFQDFYTQVWWGGEQGFEKHLPIFYQKAKAGGGRAR